jgi:hypothetical protein
MGKRRLVLCMLTALIPFCAVARASAQMYSSATSLILDPSARAAGMGRASNAVFWGVDPDYWANPAVIGYYKGIRFVHGSTQLVPDHFDDVFFTSDRTALGAWGVGIAVAGDPFRNVGEMRLDYGEIPIVVEGPDGEGVQIGTHSPYELVRTFSIGAGVLELATRLMNALGRDAPGAARFGEVSVGYTRKSYKVDLGPAVDELDLLEPIADVATTYDRGILLRMTPYNSLDYDGYFPRLDSVVDWIAGGFRFDVAFGSSLQNYNNVVIELIDARPSPVSKVARDGWAVHAASGLPSGLRRFLEGHGLGLIAESLTPLLSWGKAWDRVNPVTRIPGTDGTYTERGIEERGWELEVAGIWAVRRGRIDSPDEKIHGDTSGWSLGFKLAGLGGFRYDKATFPQGGPLGPVEPEGYVIWVDPVAVWRAVN